ncbi:hypothetical protein V1291_000008 [Nitrobacteraceae bacterium AZCC 1564]
MTLRQRDPRQHDRQHLAYVRSLPCCVCGSLRNVEAAHIRMGCIAIGKDPTGMQEKPHDRWTVPLCHYHHQSGTLAQHKVGEETFWREIHGLNPFAIAARLWTESGGEARVALPAPVKQPRKIKARKPRDKRKKIGPSRPLQSRWSFPARKFSARALLPQASEVNNG